MFLVSVTPGFSGAGADVAEQMKNLKVDNEEEDEEEEDEEDSVLTAASAGDVELLEKLIDEKADVNKSDGEGRTALANRENQKCRKRTPKRR